MANRIVIVGGVAAGASAAAKARRVDESAEIVVFEKGPYVSFANCGLPYYIGGDIPNRSSLFLQTPESFWNRFRVRVFTGHEVTAIHRDSYEIEVRNLESGEIRRERYDKLILATGAGAIVPPLPGVNSPNVFCIKTVPESDTVRSYVETAKPRHAVVVGAGFIGLEAAEALKHRGLDVTVVEMLPQVLPPFDPDMAALVATHLTENGLHLILSDGIKAFHGEDRVHDVELQSGRKVPADLVILSIGVRPELKLAQDCGLQIGNAGGIVVNDHQQTSDPAIYAAGDATEVIQLVTGRPARIPLAGPANKAGRVAGANAAGLSLTFPGALGTAIVATMGITSAKTGLSEREAKQAGLNVVSSITHSLDHAGYYPGGELIHMKVLSEAVSGRLLGAQVIGERGVDKRIDVLATALMGKMNVTDLEKLDLAYAPPFSSAKDPVVIAGFVASNLVRGETAAISCAELRERQAKKEPLQIVDVRTPAEFAGNHLPGAVAIPIDELRSRLHELDKSKPTIVYCRVGLRGYLAARILQQSGFGDVKNLSGGLMICRDVPSEGSSPMTQDSIEASRLDGVLRQPDSVVVDVREADEYRFEHIAGTKNIPLSALEADPHSAPGGKDIYLLCQSGARSASAVRLLREAGYPRVWNVDGGMNAYKRIGKVERRRGPLPIMRQVQIVAGSLVLLGTLIPGGRWLAAFVGAGLIFAGCSGFCGMASLLSKMPWNKPRNPDASTSGSACAPCPRP